MDSFTERMLERAKARQKMLKEHYNNTNETPKASLQEPNSILMKYEQSYKPQPSSANKTKQRGPPASNLDPCAKNIDPLFKENMSDNFSVTRVSSEYQTSPKTPTKTLNIQKENFNMEIKLTSTENVRVEVEIEERDEFEQSDSDSRPGRETKETMGRSGQKSAAIENLASKFGETDAIKVGKVVEGQNKNKKNSVGQKSGEESSGIRKDVKNRLQRLGKLYSDTDELSSPIHRAEAKFHEDLSSSDDLEVISGRKEGRKPANGGLGRLKALATTRNEWEDEISPPHNKSSEKEALKKSWKAPAPKPPTVSNAQFVHSPKKGPAPKPPSNNGVNEMKKGSSRESSPEKRKSARKSPVKGQGDGTRPVCWDNDVLASLESQGFTRTNSNTRLVYSYKKDSATTSEQGSNPELTPGSKLNSIKESDDSSSDESEQATAKIPQHASKYSPKPDSKSSKREPPKFPQKKPESTKTSANNFRSGDVINKAALFEKSSVSPSKAKDPALMSVSERKALFERNKGEALIPKAAFGMAAPIKQLEKENKAQISTAKPNSPQKVQRSQVSQHINTVLPAKPSISSSRGESPGKLGANYKDSPTKSLIAESGGIASKMKALLEKKTTISQTQIVSHIQEQRQKDLDILLNRFHRNKQVEEVELSSDEEEEEEEEIMSETTRMIREKCGGKIVQFGEKNGEKMVPSSPATPPQQNSGAPKRRSAGDSPRVREILDEVKRIRVSPPKVGRIYPCLSDIEASTETEPEPEREPKPGVENYTFPSDSDTSYEANSSVAESEEPNTSFGREILEVVCKNQTPQKRPIYDDSTASDISSVLDGMDDYLDEALAQGDSEYSEGPTPPKHHKSTPPRNTAAPSNSFHYSKGTPQKYNSPNRAQKSPQVSSSNSPKISKMPTEIGYSPKKGLELPTHVVDGENVMPLTHTVSFYRRQQAQGVRTPIRQVTRQPAVEEESPEKLERDESIEVTQKIQELMNTVSKQQTVISQASQALNLCCSTIEFSGSSEQVEAERLLLVATQRRQAALHEVQRLRVEGTLHPTGGSSTDNGTLIISDISLPLKKEYVRALAAAGGLGHHVVCLIRYAEHVLPTRLTSTVASPKDGPEMDLRIPGLVKLENVYSDFTIRVEVYTLQAQEELLPHELKYHISTKKGGNKLTPKKILKQESSKLVMPSVQSPAGPQAVRSPSFALMGYVVFSLQGTHRSHWTLNNAPAMSPLEGSIQMKVRCELAVSVEHRGFLTMFDDVSGFGAWHRRWCLLRGHSLSYWKYPDDERKKPPIDSINLQICVTKTTNQVSRDICARPHTFLLETLRPAKSTDKDSLVTVCKGDQTMIRHLLSADTKEERIEWCEKMNKALEALRLWGNSTLRK